MTALDAAALRSLRGAVPDVRPPPKWFEPGYGWLCVLLVAVNAAEWGFVIKCLFFR
jgi:hypothetical protein